jgi:hypothetical protein
MILALAAVLVDDDFWVLVLLCFIQSWCNAWALTCQYPCHLPPVTDAESAEVLGLSERSVKQYWSHAKTWLCRETQSMKA